MRISGVRGLWDEDGWLEWSEFQSGADFWGPGTGCMGHGIALFQRFQSGADFWGPGTLFQSQRLRWGEVSIRCGFLGSGDREERTRLHQPDVSIRCGFLGSGDTTGGVACSAYPRFQSGADFWGPGTEKKGRDCISQMFQSGADFWGPGTAPRFVGVLSWANAGRCANLSLAAGR